MSFRTVLAWLRDVPVTDPLDRRNAPFVQGLLLFYVAFVAINKTLYLWAVFGGNWSARPHLASDIATDVLLCAAALVAVGMIRSGRFRQAVWVFIGTALLITVYIYALVGIYEVAFEVFPLMLVALAGLVLGRRNLWIVAGVQMVCYLWCMVSNLIGFVPTKASTLAVVGITFSTMGAYMLMTILIDCAVNSLRASLAESMAKSRRLEREMAEREHTQALLLHAQKMEVVGQVACGVAHDFDNVLSVILGYTSRRERLADGGSGKLLNALEGIDIAAHRATVISRNLLRFSRFESEHVETVEMGTAVQLVQPMLRQLFGAHIQLDCACAPESLPVLIDPGQLELVLLSLAGNARDAMPTGGRFSIRVVRDGGAVEVALADTGKGIGGDDMAHLFTPFFTTKPTGQGTGLGLAVVKEVVEHAGGNVQVTSALGRGSTFTLRLPLMRIGVGRAARAPARVLAGLPVT